MRRERFPLPSTEFPGWGGWGGSDAVDVVRPPLEFLQFFPGREMYSFFLKKGREASLLTRYSSFQLKARYPS